MSKSDWLPKNELLHVLAALTPPNRLAAELSLVTGLRISDVLNIKSDGLSRRITVRQLKTGKNRRIYIPAELFDRMLALKGRYFVFEHRLDPKRPRTRSAVYKDIKRAARAFRIDLQVSPHSARKVYAVEQFQTSGSLKHVQELLSHSDEAVTMLYALADRLTVSRYAKKK